MSERQLIAKVNELKAALDNLANATAEAAKLDSRLVQAQADQILGQSVVAEATTRVGNIRQELKALL